MAKCRWRAVASLERVAHARDVPSHHRLTLGGSSGSDQIISPQLTQRAQDRGDVAMGQVRWIVKPDGSPSGLDDPHF
jgi:hypothetical protein